MRACPFCGGKPHSRTEADLDGFGRFYWFECGGCKARSREKFATETCPQFYEEVRDAWNRRTDLTPPAADYVGGLEAALRFYADADLYSPGFNEQPASILSDAGDAANRALAARSPSPATEPPTLIDAEHSRMMRTARQHCEYCDGTGDVIRADGEWLGTCHCAAARPASPDTLVQRIAAALWSEAEGDAVERLYDTTDQSFVMEYEAKARAIIEGTGQ